MAATGVLVTVQTNLTPDLVLKPLSGQLGGAKPSAVLSNLLALLQPKISVSVNGVPVISPIAPAGNPSKPWVRYVVGTGGIVVLGLALFGLYKLVSEVTHHV